MTVNDFYRRIVDFSLQGLAVTQGTRFVFANKSFAELCGYSLEELRNFDTERLKAIVHPDDRDTVWMIAEGRLKDEEMPSRLEFRLTRKDGSLKWVELYARRTEYHGRPTTLLSCIDISGRKEAEAELKRREVLYRAIFENSGSAIALVGADHTVSLINDEFVGMTGYSRKEVENRKKWMDLIPPDQVEKLMDYNRRRRTEPDSAPKQYEMEYFTKSGERRHASISIALLPETGQRLISLIDITERNKAVDTLMESEARYRSFVETSMDMIAIVDLDGKFTFVNDAWVAGMGYSREEAYRMNGFESVHPDDIPVAAKTWEGLLAGEPVGDNELRFRKSSGEYMYTLTNFSPLRDSKGRMYAVFTASRNITERKQIEEQLRHSQVLASLGEMTAGIAHEVGNPLASIVLYSEVAMKSQGVSSQTKKDLKVIHGEAKRAGKLMKDLLVYSRKLEPKMRRLDLKTVIERVTGMLQYQLNVQNVMLEKDLHKGPLFVSGDSSQLTQVFLNLLINSGEALKKNNGGTITISSSVRKGRVRVSVSDDGPGIPEEYLDRVFMPFFTTKDVGEGTGLGLSMCYGIVSSHGGIITVRNNRQKGAVFSVELPLLGKAVQEPLAL